jgi:hypothetical protein
VLAALCGSWRCLWGIGSVAQSTEVAQGISTAAPVIPQQVHYTGVLPNRSGDVVEAVFHIYTTAEGGEPLWTETQRVVVGADGSYSVLLGAASESGLPQTVFAAGQARWVGVSIERGEETARTPLSSVAYAMKAGDAETVGGLTAANLVTKDDLAKLTQLSQASATAGQAAPPVEPEVNPTGSGTTDYVPLWTASGALGDSNIYQAASGNVGIGTTTPAGPLEIVNSALGGSGSSTMMLEQTNSASGNYYANIGLYNSTGLIGNLSALGAGYPAGHLWGASDVVFLGGQQNANTNLLFITNTSGAIKLGTGGYLPSNERLRIGAGGGISIGNSYVASDPGPGNLIVSGNVGIGTTTPAARLEVNGPAKFDGLITFGAGQTFPGTSTGTITKITASSPLTGGGTSGAVTVGLNASALETTLNGVYAQLNAGNFFVDQANFNNGINVSMTQAAGIAVNAVSTNGSVGVSGSSDIGTGVYASSTSGTAVYAISTSGPAGVFEGGSQYDAAISVLNSANFSPGAPNPVALIATANGTESTGVYGSGTLLGVYGTTTTTAGAAVEGTTSDAYAGYFANESASFPTVYAYNLTAGGPTSGIFRVFKAATPAGTCGIGDGDFSCTGELKTLATTREGTRTVETYAMQSPENWMEDFGTGTVTGGVGVVQIDPAFADTVTADASYHVFLTPNGDSKGLYVTAKTASGFEVRESGGGGSSVSFDYRIVAKRRGHEAKRLEDVTDRFNAEQAATKRGLPSDPAHGSRGVMSRAAMANANSRPGGGAVLPKAVALPKKAAAPQKVVAKPM